MSTEENPDNQHNTTDSGHDEATKPRDPTAVVSERPAASTGGQRGLLIGILIAALLGAAVWFVMARGVQNSDHYASIASSENTVLLVSMNDLDRSYRRIERILKVFPSLEGTWAMIWKNQAKKDGGFDPSKPESWEALGIDPGIGLALIVDNRLAVPGNPVPLGYLATTNLTPLIDLVAEWSGVAMPLIKGTQFNGVRLGGSALLLFAPIGNLTVMTIAENAGGESIDDVVARLKLARVLEDAWLQAPNLLGSKRYARTMGDPVGARQAMLYFDVTNLRPIFKGQPMLESVGNQLAQWMEALGGQLGDQGMVARVLTTNAGQTLVEQLVHVKGPAPQFARRLPQGAWSGMRWSINLKGVLDGLTRALPPSAPQEVRMGLGMVRVALPLATGIAWEQIAGGLSGHFMLGVGPPPATTQQPQSLLALGVADEKMADQLISTAMNSLKTRLPVTRPVAKKIGGLDGWTFIYEQMPMSLVRDGDMILIGSDASVASAISGAKSAVTAEARRDLDLESILGMFIDGTPVIPKVLAEEVKADDGLLAFTKAPFVSFRVALDNRGLLWTQNRPAHIEDVLAFMAMVEGLPLPFEFPVKL